MISLLGRGSKNHWNTAPQDSPAVPAVQACLIRTATPNQWVGCRRGILMGRSWWLGRLPTGRWTTPNATVAIANQLTGSSRRASPATSATKSILWSAALARIIRTWCWPSSKTRSWGLVLTATPWSTRQRTRTRRRQSQTLSLIVTIKKFSGARGWFRKALSRYSMRLRCRTTST